MEENEVNTEAVVETPAEPAEETQVVETQEADATEPSVEEQGQSTEVESPETVEEQPTVTFSADDPDVNTKVTEVLERYEIPQGIQAVIDHFKSKAETPQDNFADYAEYGDTDAIKALLDRQALLDSVTELETGYRPNTDKFAQSIAPDKAQWLFFDLGQLPSTKYQGLNQFEEQIADNLALEGDTVGSVLERYRGAIEAVKNGANITTNVPSFIPTNLHKAYWSLSKEDRDEIDQFSPETDRIEIDEISKQAVNYDAPIRQRKLDMLAKIQKGIDGDEYLKQQELQTKTHREQTFQQNVIQTQENFYNSIRDTFATDLAKTVQFSTDPKMQAILASQNVALLTQAFSPDADGNFARQALAQAGINFDQTKALALVKAVEDASILKARAEQIQDANGNPLNQIELNKAKAQFERAGKEWQKFANDILQQTAKLTSTGKQADVEKAATEKVEKEKMQIKARPSTKGTSSPVKTKQDIPRYGTPEYHQYWADQYANDPRYTRAT